MNKTIVIWPFVLGGQAKSGPRIILTFAIGRLRICAISVRKNFDMPATERNNSLFQYGPNNWKILRIEFPLTFGNDNRWTRQRYRWNPAEWAAFWKYKVKHISTRFVASLLLSSVVTNSKKSSHVLSLEEPFTWLFVRFSLVWVHAGKYYYYQIIIRLRQSKKRVQCTRD